jgi:hypothetical protein
LVFPLLVRADRLWGAKRLWFVVGGMTLLITHLALFWVFYGDPVYFFGIYHDYLKETYVLGDTTDTSSWSYVVLLFVKIYHTGLLGWLALAGCIRGLMQRNQPEIRFVLIWGLGLLLIFSALPISLSPLKFIAKQPNYLSIFTLPLALMAGWFLAQQGRTTAFFLGGAMIASGITLAALEQQVINVVTVNGRSAAVFAEAHTGTPVFGPLTAQRQSKLQRVLRGFIGWPQRHPSACRSGPIAARRRRGGRHRRLHPRRSADAQLARGSARSYTPVRELPDLGRSAGSE